MKLILSILLLASSLSLSGCSEKNSETLKIVANAWIGYSPLFYAKERGWLNEINIELIHVVSLGESMQLYLNGNAQAFTGTQYEFNQAQESRTENELTPIILFNRSNGGDVIMSNRSLEQLKTANTPITAYLELNSVNLILFEDFIASRQLEQKQIQLINRDQGYISTLATSELTNPVIIVTYTPYNSILAGQGFTELGSTKDSDSLLVLDALYTKESTLNNNNARFEALKKIIDQAIEQLSLNPKDYYLHVKPYLGDISYQDFLLAREGIIWLNQDIDTSTKTHITHSGFPMDKLIQ